MNRFVNKDTITEYIDPDELMERYGGNVCLSNLKQPKNLSNYPLAKASLIKYPSFLSS